jgi:hypothetical protein
MTRAGKENSRKKNQTGHQGILGRIGNGLASVETKRKENGLLKECGPKLSWAFEWKINKINQNRNSKCFWLFLKSEIDLGLWNKNMHAMKCNLSNYSKNFLPLSWWHALSLQVLKFHKKQGVTDGDEDEPLCPSTWSHELVPTYTLEA